MRLNNSTESIQSRTVPWTVYTYNNIQLQHQIKPPHKWKKGVNIKR